MLVERMKSVLVASMALMVFTNVGMAVSQQLDTVRADLTHGRADAAVARLKQILSSDDQNAEAFNLYCRVSLQLEHWDDATSQCEHAVSLSPKTSSYHLWLGRAYGAKAERASMLSAYSLARKLKTEFENAVALDPHNVEAMADLGEFYCTAPSVVGGGIGKAEALATKLMAVNAVRGHELRARIAGAEKNNSLAETELKAAQAAAEQPADSWMTLASFYRRVGRLDEMVEAVKSGIAADKQHTAALVNGASTLRRSDRELPLAIQMLREYLASSHQSEDAPAFAVHVELAKLLARQGDQPGAQREYQAALALAHNYRPAARPAAGGNG